MFNKENYICHNCGSTKSPRNITKGNLFTELILYLLGIIPGILYTAWRKNNIYLACQDCDSEDILPLDSPMGRKLEIELANHKVEPIEIKSISNESSKDSVGWGLFYRIIGSIFAFIFFVGGQSILILNKLAGGLFMLIALLIIILSFGIFEKFGVHFPKRYKILFLSALILFSFIILSKYTEKQTSIEEAEVLSEETILPSYTVIEKIKQINGKYYIYALIPEYSRETPIAEVSKTALFLAEKEGVEDLSLYKTYDAYKSNVSASYSENHPGALEEGYLGMVQQGKFFAP